MLAEQDAGVGADGLAATTDKGVTPDPATDKDTDKGLSPAAPASKAAPAAPQAEEAQGEARLCRPRTTRAFFLYFLKSTS